MIRNFFLSFIVCFFVKAQTNLNDSNLYEISKSHIDNQKNSRFKNVHFESIGPAIMSGRVVAVDVNPINPNEFYVAYASGGIWHTEDNGISFIPIMENALTQNIGEIKVNWSTKEIWVGTGENNSSRSSYAGIGILKTNNNAKYVVSIIYFSVILWAFVGTITVALLFYFWVMPKNPILLMLEKKEEKI
mgnify:CR=1 FL=1